jgi:ParB family chromosome partitioning protein
MKLEAMKRQGQRTDLTSAQLGRKFEGKESREILAEQVGQSRNQVSRFIHLCNLVPDLLDMVDNRKMGINPAYELSFLTAEEQTELLDAMDSEQTTPSLSQAQRMKKFSQEGRLSKDMMVGILSEEKKPEQDKVTLDGATLRRYFPQSYTPQRMQEVILKLLEGWQRKREQER